MKKALVLCLWAACLAGPASARNDTVHLSFQDLLVSPEVQAGLDGSVRFYLAGSKTPAVLEKRNVGMTSQAVNGVNKSPERGCMAAALKALQALQAKAKALGANAVIEIVSYHDKEESKSPIDYDCQDSMWLSRVSLKGVYAKVAK